ncbi:MAG: alpha-glucosidase MalA [Sulfolobaceae archaeon]
MIRVFENSQRIYKFEVNIPLPPIDTNFHGQEKDVDEIISNLDLNIFLSNNNIIIEKKLDIREHIVGLGEKAFELDRKRARYIMYNVDAGAYHKFSDPLYISIPFLISVLRNEFTGFFINSASKLIVDVGLEEYDKLKIFVPDDSVEFYIIKGGSLEEVIEKYSDLVGKPFLPPMWALGYIVSRYSYFPQDSLIKIVEELIKEGFKVSAVCLDIHYMDNFKIFTWHPQRFPSPQKMIDKLHSMDVKIITIIDPGIRVDQNYNIFKEGLGKYCETKEGEIFVGKLWPGSVVYPDFFREDVREWWSDLVAKWLSQGIDGIWLDMNEPTDFSRYFMVRKLGEILNVEPKSDRFLLTFPEDIIHVYKGKKVEHSRIRNAYPLYQAMATFEGFKKVGRNDVFILSRSGYAGIQRYAFVWTGDNIPSWDDLKLQLQLVLGLSISGVPYVGIDIGGFQGREERNILIDNSLELLVRYYQLSLFFPLFRTHKALNGIEIEPIFLPLYYKEKVRRVINTRYRFLPYLYSLVVEAHEKGHPIIRPLFYEFPEEEYFKIEDEFMVGKYVLYAPLLSKEDKRRVILPKGKWYDFFGNKILSEGVVMNSDELPIYIRENSIVPLEGEVIVFGKARFKMFDGTEILSTGDEIIFSKPLRDFTLRIITEEEIKRIKINNERDETDFIKEGQSIIIKIRDKVFNIKIS